MAPNLAILAALSVTRNVRAPEPLVRTAIGTSVGTLWNNQARWITQSIPKECLVPTQRQSGRHSCSPFSG